jgi:hypothetical protein
MQISGRPKPEFKPKPKYQNFPITNADASNKMLKSSGTQKNEPKLPTIE